MDCRFCHLWSWDHSFYDTSVKSGNFLAFFLVLLMFLVNITSFRLCDRYKYRKVKAVPQEELKAMGFIPTENITLESEYEKIKKMDIDTWEQKR